MGASSFLIVPVKRAVGSKQRLASGLPADVRQLLSRALAARMVRCAAEAWPAEQVVVVGDDPELATLCGRLGLTTIWDAGEGQSEAVRAGQRWCLERGAKTLVTVAADLPRAETIDLRRLLELAGQLAPNSLALIPDLGGTGTNGLLLNPADQDPFLFGPDSLRRHQQRGALLGLEVSLLDLPRLSWDVDRIEDLSPASPVPDDAHPVLAWAHEIARLNQRPLGGSDGR
ncbi:MAG TPA: 2-phospho-L-lactate guanylyltransferase [Candidatus Dormibacteraeota bacterium]